MDVEPDPPHLDPRVTRLEERVAELETQGRANRLTAAQPTPANGATDTERFWALDGLKSRNTDAGAVLFTGATTLPTGANYEWQHGVEVDSLLDTDWSLAADVLAALGHPVRLVVLREVLRGTQTVADLGAMDGFGTSGQLYHHLRQLVAAGWLRAAARGRYEVPVARVIPLLVVLAAAQR